MTTSKQIGHSVLYAGRIGAAALVSALGVGVPAASGSAVAASLMGCYERIYDAAHLKAHRGQLVVRARLSIKPARPEMQSNEIVADGDLKLWLHGTKQSFDSLGACRAQGEDLICAGSLSAAEAPTCKAEHDGVRQCRMGDGDPGSFQIEPRPNAILVTLRERLELVPAPYDGGPFLYLSPTDAENRAFLLNRIGTEGCK